jgi:uncharacterized Zn ribbon protein/predicted nucleic acid-binding Zn ribbon protein
MLRICRKCRREYDGDSGSTLCPSCVEEGKKTTIRDRICRECGASFPGGPRAWYCPDCRKERRRQQNRDFQRRGTARPLGSIDLCAICGSEYTVTSGRQRYCPACAPEAVKAADRAQGRAWYAANGDPDQRRTIRHDHAAELLCVICGKAYKPKDASLTCSKECSIALSKRRTQQYERDHRELRNEQRRKRYHKEIDDNE